MRVSKTAKSAARSPTVGRPAPFMPAATKGYTALVAKAMLPSTTEAVPMRRTARMPCSILPGLRAPAISRSSAMDFGRLAAASTTSALCSGVSLMPPGRASPASASAMRAARICSARMSRAPCRKMTSALFSASCALPRFAVFSLTKSSGAKMADSAILWAPEICVAASMAASKPVVERSAASSSISCRQGSR